MFTYILDLPQDFLELPSPVLDSECNSSVYINMPSNTTTTLAGAASVDCYEYILSRVKFVSQADEPGDTSRTIQFVLSDERGFAFNATTLVTIIPTNDPAVFSFNNSFITFNESTQEPVTLFPFGYTLVDSDGDSLQWVTVEIRPFIDEMDVLYVDLGTSGLDISRDISGASLNISGYVNFTVYATVLQTLTFQNSFPGINLANRNIHIVTFDGETESPPTVVTIAIDDFDDVPLCYFNNTLVRAVGL